MIEKLNEILDKKNNKMERTISIPENTEKPNIDISDSFRIICTSNYEQLSYLSPAFINRFGVIILEEQIEYLSFEL